MVRMERVERVSIECRAMARRDLNRGGGEAS